MGLPEEGLVGIICGSVSIWVMFTCCASCLLFCTSCFVARIIFWWEVNEDEEDAWWEVYGYSGLLGAFVVFNGCLILLVFGIVGMILLLPFGCFSVVALSSWFVYDIWQWVQEEFGWYTIAHTFSCLQGELSTDNDDDGDEETSFEELEESRTKEQGEDIGTQTIDKKAMIDTKTTNSGALSSDYTTISGDNMSPYIQSQHEESSEHGL